MRSTLFLSLFFICFLSQGQPDSVHIIKVHFLYGSKPTKKFKSTEKKYFGGLHGGHVSIEVDNIDYGFSPKEKFHLFSHKHKRHSIFHGELGANTKAHDKSYKVTSFIIPLTPEQYKQIKQINSDYCQQTPYDYAFLGMRCAAASQDVLGQIGIVKKRKRLKNIRTTFYPKKLRKRMFRLAKEKNYTIEKQEGRTTRKWEND